MAEFNGWSPTPAQRSVLEKLRTEVEAAGGQAAFARNFKTYRDSTLSKILAVLAEPRRRSYFDEVRNPQGTMEDVEAFVLRIPGLRVEREKNSKVDLHEFHVFKDVLDSVKETLYRPTPVRITKYIAGTGGGKTFLRRYLTLKLDEDVAFHSLEARMTWYPETRDSRERALLNVLRDFYAAFDMDVDGEKWMPKYIQDYQNALCEFCNARDRVLFIDEAEFFSRGSLNFIKWLLNESKLVLVLGVLPAAHAMWNSRFQFEAEQIARRTNRVVSMNPLPAQNQLGLNAEQRRELDAKWRRAREDAALFFPDNQFAKPEEALNLIVQESRKFGLFQLVEGVAKRLAKTSEADMDEVETAIANAWKPMSKRIVKARTA